MNRRSAKPSSSILATILAAGSLAGVLDFSWAAVVAVTQGRTPIRMLQGIASGWLGKAAFSGGGGAAILGLAFHFAIAFGAATVYVLAGRAWPAMHRRYLLAGAAFGIGVHLFMQTVVLPLSRIGWRWSLAPRELLLGLTAHVLCVGLPIALLARRGAASRA